MLEIKPIPTYRRTTKQDKVRKHFIYCIQQWRNLTPEEKEEWKKEGAKLKLTGYQAYLSWCLKQPFAEFKYEITINNTQNTNTLTDYQILISVSNDATFCTDFANDHKYMEVYDADMSTMLNFYVEEWDTTNKNAKIWVKVPSIPASSTKKIYLAYNPNRTTPLSNGNNTFIFFDDFEGRTTPDPNKWTVESGSAVIENGKLKLVGSSVENRVVALLTLDTSKDYEWYYKGYASATNNGWGSYIFYVNVNNTYRYVHRDYYYTTLSQIRLNVCINGVWSDVTTYLSKARDTNPHTLKVRKYGNTWTILWDNNIASGSHTPQWASGKAIAPQTEINFAGTVWIDIVFVRKYASPEPTITYTKL
ncbi:MAG: DUF2341 domain-containing protein [Nitrososphaeria archaeon]